MTGMACGWSGGRRAASGVLRGWPLWQSVGRSSHKHIISYTTTLGAIVLTCVSVSAQAVANRRYVVGTPPLFCPLPLRCFLWGGPPPHAPGPGVAPRVPARLCG